VIYIIGAGGFARQVLNIFIDLSKDNEVEAFLEENCQRRGTLLNDKPVEDLSTLTEKKLNTCYKLVCAIGTPLRKRIIEYTRELGYEYETIVHPHVIMSKWVTLSDGAIICAGNILENQINIDRYVIINKSCTIGHDVTIGKYTTIGPGVNIGGNVNIAEECNIGIGAKIVEKVNIGKRSYIGAGAVVVNDIPENVLAFGVPAKPIRKLTEEDWVKLM